MTLTPLAFNLWPSSRRLCQGCGNSVTVLCRRGYSFVIYDSKTSRRLYLNVVVQAQFRSGTFGQGHFRSYKVTCILLLLECPNRLRPAPLQKSIGRTKLQYLIPCGQNMTRWVGLLPAATAVVQSLAGGRGAVRDSRAASSHQNAAQSHVAWPATSIPHPSPPTTAG